MSNTLVFESILHLENKRILIMSSMQTFEASNIETRHNLYSVIQYSELMYCW